MVTPGRSLKWQLSKLCLGLLLPTLAFMGVLLWEFAASERSRVEEQARFLSRSLAIALDREVNGVLATLQALATSPSLQTHDLAALYAQASEIRRLQGIHISLRSVDGTTVLTTRAPLGAAVPVPALLAATDREILRSGKATVSDVFTSATSGLPVFQIVAAPISVGGVRTYLLAASVDLDFLSAAIRRESLPQGWVGALVDRNGLFAVRTEQQAAFAGQRSSADFRAHLESERGSFYGSNTAGQRVLAGYARSSLTGWMASANVGSDIVDAPLRRSLLLLVGLGLSLVLISASIGLIVARRVNQAMQKLGGAAEAIGRGNAVAPLSTPITEVNEVGRALEVASRQLQDRGRERDEAEAFLREREERLRLVVEGARDHAIFTTDAAGTITSWSAGAEAIFGWTAAEAVGQPAALTFAPEDCATGADRTMLAAAARDGRARDERWHLCKGGHRAFMNGSVHRLDRDASGHDRGFLVITRDETERRRADQALRDLNETLETQVAERTRERDRAWRNSRDLQIVIDESRIFLAVSPAVTAILGWTVGEVTGRTVLDLVHPDDADATAAAFARSAAGRPSEFESRYRHKDGSFRWLSWVAGAEADLVYASGRDVEAQKEQEAALQQSEAALRQAQKMEAVGQLTGGIAHDFNNLLAGIIGSLDLMQSRIAQGRMDTVERYAKAAAHSAQRAAALTHRLLAFSRRQPLDPRPVQPNALVASMEDLLRRTIGPLHPLEVVMAGGVWTTLCDPHQLENAILNLAINARDAMPHGGTVVIEASNASLDDAYVAKQRDVKPGQYVCISVSDTGSGMTADVIGRAFEPFFTTKPMGQGTGLGLSMVYGFAKQSEGHLKLYSEVGRGTTVKVYLPRHNGDATAVEQAVTGESIMPTPAGKGETVLVVEDEPVIRALIVDVLEELGYRTLEAGNGQAGLSLLQSRARIDLVVTDVGLPGLNGRQLVDQAREMRPNLKALFITGYAENATLANGFLDPGMEMITKPFTIAALTDKVSRMMQAESVLG